MNKMIITALFLLFPLNLVAQEIPPPEKFKQQGNPQRAQAPIQNNQGRNPDEPDGFTPEAGVRIISEGDKIIEEYSLNGRVYMIKIQHKGFPPYYLIDRNGDGRMDEQVSELMGPGAPPPTWTLFRW